MTKHLSVDLTTEAFQGLLTFEARRDYLTASLLRQMSDEGPPYVLLHNDDSSGGVHPVAASQWAAGSADALGVFLGVSGDDEAEEREHADVATFILLGRRARHTGLTARRPAHIAQDEILDARRVMDGVLALREDPRLAQLADHPPACRVDVDVDVEALLQGRRSVLEVSTLDQHVPDEPDEAVRAAPIDLSSIDLAYTAAASHGSVESTSREEAVEAAAQSAVVAATGPGQRPAPPSRRERARAAQRWEQNRDYVQTRQQDLDRDR